MFGVNSGIHVCICMYSDHIWDGSLRNIYHEWPVLVNNQMQLLILITRFCAHQ